MATKPKAKKLAPQVKQSVVGEVPTPELADEDPSDIKMYFHCRKCIEEMPVGWSPKEWSHLGAGWTEKGLQLWCNRHDINVVALDFKGQKIGYDEKWHPVERKKS